MNDRAEAMYANDSFHTLTLPGQVGLIALSLALTASLLVLSWWLMAKRSTLTRAAIAVSFFYLFVWLSPQAYYGYYLMLFDSLVWQNVIKPPPSPQTILALLTFQGPATLSDHANGLLGWGLILLAFAVQRFRRSGD